MAFLLWRLKYNKKWITLYFIHCILLFRCSTYIVNLQFFGGFLGTLDYIERGNNVMKVSKYLFTKEHIDKHFFLYYTFAFSVLIGSIIIIFSIKRNSFIWCADGYNQFYPVFYYIAEWLKKCIKEGVFLQFDFNVGLGEGIIPVLNFYGFGDPFLVLALFVPKNMLIYFTSFIVIVKMYVSGITFAIYCLYYDKGKWGILIGSLLYSFSSYSLCYGFQFWNFLMPMITFPILVLGIDMLVKGDKKAGLPLIIAAFLQSMCSLYFLYMEIVFGILYYVIHYLFSKKNERKLTRFLYKTIIGIFTYMIGMCMAGIILVPSIIAFFNSTRVGNSSKISLFYDGAKYIQSFQNLIIPRAFEDVLGITIISLISILAIFSTKLFPQYELVLGIIIIGFIMPVFGYVMGGFSYPNDRWTFILQFFFSFIVVIVLENSILFTLGKKLYYIMSIPIFSCIMHIISIENGSMIRGIIYLILSIFFIFCMINIVKGKIRTIKFILLFIMVNLLLNIFMIFGPVKLGGSGFRAGFKSFNEIDKELANNPVIGLNDKSQFYRVDVINSTRGEAMLLDYYGTAEYFSMINKNIYEFYDGMMISPGKGVSSWALKNLDGRMILDSLLTVKYAESFQKDGYIGKLEKNNYFLPLGYVYPNFIEKDRFMKYSPLERQEIMLQAVVIENDEESEVISFGNKRLDNTVQSSFGYSPIDGDINYININKNGDTIQVNNESKIEFCVKEYTEGENYIYLEGVERNFDNSEVIKLKVGNKEVELSGKGKDDILINIETADNVTLTFSKEGTYKIKKICLYHLSEEHIKEAIEKLRRNSMQDIRIKDNIINGKIDSDVNGLLFLSIPYGKGWEAYIDGEKTDIYKANLGFVAISIEKGEHSVEFKYTTPGIFAGGILTVVGWLLCVGVVVKMIVEKKVRGAISINTEK